MKKPKKNRKIKVILISSVRPEPTSAGYVILYRHLINKPGIDLEVYGAEPRGHHWSAMVRKVIGKIGQTISPKLAGDIWALWSGQWIDYMLPKNINRKKPTLVMTVAHGDGFMAAMRFAKKNNLPLLSLYQDWWPDMALVHDWAKYFLEKHFSLLAERSNKIICVSKGMQTALNKKNSTVLPPIPESFLKRSSLLKKQSRNIKFRIIYFGSLGYYGPSVAQALKCFLENRSVELIVRGNNPNWPKPFIDEMKSRGLLLPFAPRSTLDEWLESADAFLIPMVFDPALRRRMETSFPSKLIEFSQFGKPLIVWGPEYCSAVQWARRGGKALVVTESQPKALVKAVEKMASSKKMIQKLSRKSEQSAKTEFYPPFLQKQFFDIIQKTATQAKL